MPQQALLIIDVQNDFLPGGALPVPHGDEVIDVANRCAAAFALVIATADWHPSSHVSFAANHAGRKQGDIVDVDGRPQVLWESHCVAGTHGAELAARLDRRRITRVFHKGQDPHVDSYSAFFDDARRSTGLAGDLRAQGVTEVYLLGVATDYCVASTARDALAEGFQVTIIVDGCRGIDLHTGDVAAALADLRARGARLIDSSELATSLARSP